MTQNTYSLASIPHHLVHEVLDKSAGNWAAWERAVLSCLILARLDGHPLGTEPCPDPTIDPAGTANWRRDDSAIVAFFTLKASWSEQAFIAGYAAGGAKAVWDALVARHFDASPQIRLIREMLSVRYGVESAAATSARIDSLATRIFALGPISKTTLISAVTVNAVQGDTQNSHFAVDTHGARSRSPHVDIVGSVSPAERNAISAVSGELSYIQRELSPAVLAFTRLSSAQGSNEAEWTRLFELLFQVLGRLDSVAIAPEWDRAILSRRNALDEVQRLQETLQNTSVLNSQNSPPTSYLNAAEETVRPAETIEMLNVHDPPSQAEQSVVAHIASELANIRDVLAPAVSSFPEISAQENVEKERRHLSRLLLETIQRLDATQVNLDWEQARQDRRTAIKAVEQLQNTLESLPTCAEEHAIETIASERSQTQLVLMPAVAVYLRNPNEREQARLSELLLQALERLDGVLLESAWQQARRERREAVNEVQTLQNSIEPPPRSTQPSSVHATTEPSGVYAAISAIAAERSKIEEELSPAVVLLMRTAQPSTRPNATIEKERLRLSEVSLRFLERLDGIAIEPDWEEARGKRRSAVKEVQRLQEMLDRL